MKRVKKFSFAILAATVLFTLGSCQKVEPEFDFTVSLYVIQSKEGTDDYMYDLYFALIGYNEAIQDASITFNSTSIPIVSNVQGTYETMSFARTDIRSFNGTYLFAATSPNSNSSSFSATLNFQNSPLDEFTVEGFRYENGQLHADFKNIDSEAIACGFYINPIIDNVPAISKIYAVILEENINPGRSEYSVSFTVQEHPDYKGLRIYPMISKANGSVRQLLLGDMLEIE